MDVAVHARARQAEVTPLCPSVWALPEPLASAQTYHKALCLLYGVGVPLQVATARDLLRQVAPSQVEAQLALADSLQDGNLQQQQEALQWYARAAALEDVRAKFRHARLAQRLASAVAAPPAPMAQPAAPDLFDDPYADGRELPPGYHCHFYGMGKKVCHGMGVD